MIINFLGGNGGGGIAVDSSLPVSAKTGSLVAVDNENEFGVYEATPQTYQVCDMEYQGVTKYINWEEEKTSGVTTGYRAHIGYYEDNVFLGNVALTNTESGLHEGFLVGVSLSGNNVVISDSNNPSTTQYIAYGASANNITFSGTVGEERINLAAFTADTQALKDALDSGATVTWYSDNYGGEFVKFVDDPKHADGYYLHLNSGSYDNYRNIDDFPSYLWAWYGGYPANSLYIKRSNAGESGDTIEIAFYPVSGTESASTPFSATSDIVVSSMTAGFYVTADYEQDGRYYVDFQRFDTYSAVSMTGINLADWSKPVYESATTCTDATFFAKVDDYHAFTSQEISLYNSGKTQQAGDTVAVVSAKTEQISGGTYETLYTDEVVPVSSYQRTIITSALGEGSITFMVKPDGDYFAEGRYWEHGIIISESEGNYFLSLRQAWCDGTGDTRHEKVIAIAPFDLSNPTGWTYKNQEILIPNEVCTWDGDKILKNIVVKLNITKATNKYTFFYNIVDPYVLQNGRAVANGGLWHLAYVGASASTYSGIFQDSLTSETHKLFLKENVFTEKLAIAPDLENAYVEYDLSTLKNVPYRIIDKAGRFPSEQKTEGSLIYDLTDHKIKVYYNNTWNDVWTPPVVE